MQPRHHHSPWKRAKAPPQKYGDWDAVFKWGLLIALLLSAVLLVLNYFYGFTQHYFIAFFSLPTAWAIVGMFLAHRFSAPEQRNMHQVSDYILLSLCGYFVAFFLVLYGLKDQTIFSIAAAVILYFIFYYYSWRSLNNSLCQKNILLERKEAWRMGLLLFLLSLLSAFLFQFWNRFGAIIILIGGTIGIFQQYWSKLSRQFEYSRYRTYLTTGIIFNFLSLVLWTLAFTLSALILLLSAS